VRLIGFKSLDSPPFLLGRSYFSSLEKPEKIECIFPLYLRLQWIAVLGIVNLIGAKRKGQYVCVGDKAN